MNAPSLPWTPGGIDLLEKIKDIVEENGGRAAYYDLVRYEVEFTDYQKHQFRVDEIIRITIKRKIPYKESCELIPMPLTEFSRKIAEYKKLNTNDHDTKNL